MATHRNYMPVIACVQSTSDDAHQYLPSCPPLCRRTRACLHALTRLSQDAPHTSPVAPAPFAGHTRTFRMPLPVPLPPNILFGSRAATSAAGIFNLRVDLSGNSVSWASLPAYPSSSLPLSVLHLQFLPFWPFRLRDNPSGISIAVTMPLRH
jgi:hypothetical protein